MLVPPGVQNPTINHTSVQNIGNANLDQNGHFSIAFPDNNLITPAGTQWKITVNARSQLPWPMGTGSQTLSVTLTITGAAMDISSQLSAVAPSLTNVCPNTNLVSAVLCPGSGSSIQLQTNGVNNLSQVLLNLVNGAGATVTNVSGGIVQVSATGGTCPPPGSTLPGMILTADVDFGGISGYLDGGTGQLFNADGTSFATYLITNAVDGVVQPGGITISTPGAYYVAGQTYPTSVTSGGGDGTLTITASTVSTGSNTEFLYDDAGTCAGSIYYYGTDPNGVTDSFLGQNSTSDVQSLVAVNPLEILLTTNVEEARTATLIYNGLSFTANAFSEAEALTSEYTFDQATFSQVGTNLSGTYQVGGWSYLDSAGNPAGSYNSENSVGATNSSLSFVGNGVPADVFTLSVPDDAGPSVTFLWPNNVPGGDTCLHNDGGSPVQTGSWGSCGGGTVNGTATQLAFFSSSTEVNGIPNSSQGGDGFQLDDGSGDTLNVTPFDGIIQANSTGDSVQASLTQGPGVSLGSGTDNSFCAMTFTGTSPNVGVFFTCGDAAGDQSVIDGSTLTLTAATGETSEIDATTGIFLGTPTANAPSPILQFKSESAGPTEALFELYEDTGGNLNSMACKGASLHSHHHRI